MADEIGKIRELLDKLEGMQSESSEKSFKASFELFELPEIITSVVDFLQPVLTPYELAIYLFLFRQSILRSGENYVRVSGSTLQRVVKPVIGSATEIGRDKIRETLIELENKGVIKKIGDTNQSGTPYQIFLPEEIPVCQQRMKETIVEELPQIDPKKEADYYNIKENRVKVFERDGYKCHYCGKQLTRFSVTLDHIQPVSQGGDNSFDNLTTACLQHNSMRGAKPVMDFIITTQNTSSGSSA